MAKIKSVSAYKVLDSRGYPTIEAVVILNDGTTARSMVPSGASKGTYEALELRDGGAEYGGMDVNNAINNVNKIIAPNLEGAEVGEQQKIDRTMIELDGTQNKSKLGANAILSVSQAVLKAAAKSSLLPLPIYIRHFMQAKEKEERKMPTPLFNILEGGKHASNGLDFQEFMVIPATSKSFDESLKIGAASYHALKKILEEKSSSIATADEGGFEPDAGTNVNALNMIKSAIESSGYKFSLDAFIGLDIAANNFKSQDKYKIKDKQTPLSVDELEEFYKQIVTDFGLMYMEDPFAEDDWNGWKKIFADLSSRTLVVGDDLVTTNPYRLQIALDNNVMNAIIIKPNQIGTITETVAVVEIAKFKNLKIIVSHRSGETTDDFIADFAVGVGADYVKFGAPSRERIVKYNRLLEIEREMQKI